MRHMETSALPQATPTRTWSSQTWFHLKDVSAKTTVDDTNNNLIGGCLSDAGYESFGSGHHLVGSGAGATATFLPGAVGATTPEQQQQQHQTDLANRLSDLDTATLLRAARASSLKVLNA